jgi:hypothetical protein
MLSSLKNRLRLAGRNFGLAIGVADSLPGGVVAIFPNFDMPMYDFVSENNSALLIEILD